MISGWHPARGDRAFELGKSQVGFNAKRPSQREFFEIEPADGVDISCSLLEL